MSVAGEHAFFPGWEMPIIADAGHEGHIAARVDSATYVDGV